MKIPLYSVDYTLNSFFDDDLDNEAYIRNNDDYDCDEDTMSQYQASMYSADINLRDNKYYKIIEKIGELHFQIVHIGNLIDYGIPFKYAVGNGEEFDVALNQILNLDRNEVKDDIYSFFNYDLINLDILYIDTIEICEAYRGKGIGTKVIKDLYLRFGNNCRLIVAEVEPMQFFSRLSRSKKWKKKLNLSTLDTDYEKAKLKLMAFCQRSYLHPIEGYDGLVFHNPGGRYPLEETDTDTQTDTDSIIYKL